MGLGIALGLLTLMSLAISVLFWRRSRASGPTYAAVADAPGAAAELAVATSSLPSISALPPPPPTNV